MSDEKVLTEEFALEFVGSGPDRQDEMIYDLEQCIAIEDGAAEILSEHEGDLDLDGLTTSAATKSLGKHKGSLVLTG